MRVIWRSKSRESNVNKVFATLAALSLAACSAQQQPSDIFDQIAQRCGQSFAGAMTSDDPRDADFASAALALEVRSCTDTEIRMPFHVGDDHSRTFILTRLDDGRLRFKHDHRHQDGVPDALSMYGGETTDAAGLNRAEFPADLETKALFDRADIPDSKQNTWSLTVSPTVLTYTLVRPGREFAAEFNLTDVIDSLPAPWGEGLIADKIFTGGPIYTGVEDSMTAEVVAVAGDRIVFAGDEIAGRVLISDSTETIDLAGNTLFPGFTDSHLHVIGVGQRERNLDLEGVASVVELQERVAEAASDQTASAITGRGWIETHWPEDRFPTAADLDAIESERPVVLGRADGHALVANTVAMERAGITDESPDPEGGAILRDENGKATGMFIDTAMAAFVIFMVEPEGEERASLYELGANVLASYGWTGVHDMSVNGADVALVESLDAQGRLAIRTAPYINPEDYEIAADRVGSTPLDAMVLAPGVKFYMDGALGSRGAALLEPYDDAPGETGLELTREQVARDMMDRALADGVQLAIHAIGDAGNRDLLDWMEASFTQVPQEDWAKSEPRWRVEHAQVLHPDDIPRFGQMGVIASMQPSHAIGDLHFAPSRIGLNRLEGAYAWQSLVDTNAMIAGGSDAPVERGEARIEFYAAAVRRDLNGYAGEGWNLDQALDRETALKLFTIWPAYATGREDVLGTIESGKLADFSVFNIDLMTAPDLELKDAVPVMTVVGGEIVFQIE
jgi:predicted amidohydrolase YtcJ